MIKAIIFDMDGTMIDTERIKEKAWVYAGNCLGIKIDDEILSQIRGTDKKYIKEFFCEQFQYSFDFNELYQLREKFIEKHIEKNGIVMKNGLIQTLEFLKNNHYKLAVASSSSMQKIQKYLTKINILNFFDVILGADDIKAGKPNPEIYQKAVEKLNVSKEECIGVEDSINGILALYRAGIKAIMIPDLEEPSKEIEMILYAKLNSLTDIITLLEK